ncbi:MAG: RsmD family RNA methyltransferase [Rickettsiales bacterium]|jgi:16S rRNA (guanine966-N2)-methyltransferase|nr:RsmD family RNA methyltransferase [Rickettsiales bacterium]
MDSKLQIISGKHRGRRLALPDGARPTQNRARIALFNMLESLKAAPDVVWDAFAGSGAFGIEFLSRHAAIKVKFTDISPDSIKTIKKNLVGIGGAAEVSQTDAIAAVDKYGADADLVFIDPPFAAGDLGAAFVKKIAMAAKSGTILVWELENGANFDFSDADWTVVRDKTYGRARFLILKKS